MGGTLGPRPHDGTHAVTAVPVTVLAPTQTTDLAVPDDGPDPWTVYVLAWLASQRSPGTTRAYRIVATQWTTWCTHHGLDPLRVRRQHLDVWAAHLRDHGGHSGRPAAAKTVARKLATIASLYAYLVVEGVLEHSPVQHVRRPDVSRDYAATVSLDEGQVRAVLAAARDESPTLYALVLTLVTTGLRVAEALAADVTDLVDDHGHRCVNVTRKGGHRARVVLQPAAAHAIDQAVAGRVDGPLFAEAGGGRYRYTAVLWTLTRVGRRAGLPATLRLHPHMLRASFATLAFDAGVPGDRVQDCMGHADPRTTRLYDRGRGKLRRLAEPGAAVARAVADRD